MPRRRKIKRRAPELPDDLLTPPQLAELLNVTPQTIRNWCKAPDGLPHYSRELRGHTRYYISESEAIEWLEEEGLLP
jgi:hypothetical protein